MQVYVQTLAAYVPANGYSSYNSCMCCLLARVATASFYDAVSVTCKSDNTHVVFNYKQCFCVLLLLRCTSATAATS